MVWATILQATHFFLGPVFYKKQNKTNLYVYKLKYKCKKDGFVKTIKYFMHMHMAYAASCKCDKANLSYKIADCHILLIEAIYFQIIIQLWPVHTGTV